ncbi:MAG: DUF4190 domain-containing protein [Rhodanobacter sp.]|jgi:hypothetical protein
MSEQPPYGAGPSTSSLAVVSLVFGVLGWCVLPFIGPLVAIICGHLARAEIRRASVDNRMEGDGMAIAGLVLGYLQFAVGLLLLMAFVVFLILGVTLRHWH